MATRIHPKNVHEKSPKNVHEMSPKKRTSHGQKCPRNVTKSVHEMSPLLSTRCLPPNTTFSQNQKSRWCICILLNFWILPPDWSKRKTNKKWAEKLTHCRKKLEYSSKFKVQSSQTVILNIYNIFCKINPFRNYFNSLCSTSIYLFVLLEIEFFNFGKKLQLLHARVQSGPWMHGRRN